MSKQPRTSVFERLALTGVVAAFGAYMGAFNAWLQDWDLGWKSSAIWGSMIFAVPVFLYLSAAEAQSREEGRRRKADMDAADLERKRKSVEMVRQRTLETVNRCARDVVTHYQTAAEFADTAGQWTRSATSRHENGAFTPFWESVENATLQLNGMRIRINSITTSTREYYDAVDQLAGSSPKDLSKAFGYPNGIKVNELREVGESIARSLQSLTDQAHTDYRFASIYEQRRTTAAVVQGFNSLSAAIYGMSAAIEVSTETLRSHVESGDRKALALMNVNREVDWIAPNQFSFEGQLKQVNEHLRQLRGGK